MQVCSVRLQNNDKLPFSNDKRHILPMSSVDLAHNISSTQDKIQAARQEYNCVHDVQLIAVSKTRSADECRLAFNCGQTHFGENYLQEALDKISALAELDIVWHFIGPIQKNKTRPIAENFDWVHSVDREIIAERLNQQRPSHLPPLKICIQINIDDEDSKSGIAPEQLPAFAEKILTLPNIEFAGLMAIPRAQADFDSQYETFKQLRLLLNSLKPELGHSNTLSMGMSNDYQAAIAAGSTMVRIGTAIFGPRRYPKE